MWFVEVQKCYWSEGRGTAFWLWVVEITLEQKKNSLEHNFRCVYLHACIWKRFVRVNFATYAEVSVSTLIRQLASSHKRSVPLTKPEKKQLLNSAENPGEYMLCLGCNISVMLTVPEDTSFANSDDCYKCHTMEGLQVPVGYLLWIQQYKRLSKIKTELKKGKCDHKPKLKQFVADQKCNNSNENVFYYRH